MTGDNPSLHLQGPLAFLASFTGNKRNSNPLQATGVLSLTEILKMSVDPWDREFATAQLAEGWPADFAPHPGPYPLNNIDSITGQWSLGLQEWTQRYVAWQEGQGDGLKLKDIMLVRLWNISEERVKSLNKDMTTARLQLKGAETAFKTRSREIEQTTQDAVANANAQKATITKLEEEVAQLKAEKVELAGVRSQTETIDTLQKQVVQLLKDKETLTRNEPTVVSMAQRLRAELDEAEDTNRKLKNDLAMKMKEEKRREKSPGKEPCTHEGEFATLRKEKSDAEAETFRFREEMRTMQDTMMVSRASALEESNRLKEELSNARSSIRQINRTNHTLRDLNTRLGAASDASNNTITTLYQEMRKLEYSLEASGEARAGLEAELGQKTRDLKTRQQLETNHRLETDKLHTTILRLENGIRGFEEDKKIDDEAKSLLEYELTCFKREYERKIEGPKEDAPLSARQKKRERKRNRQATQPVVPEKQDGTVQKEGSEQFDEFTPLDGLKMVVLVVLLLLFLIFLDGWIH
jgi:hypothetical protein